MELEVLESFSSERFRRPGHACHLSVTALIDERKAIGPLDREKAIEIVDELAALDPIRVG